LAGLSESADVKGILEKGWLGILDTQVIGNSRVRVLQCLKWAELGNSITMGYWLLCLISGESVGEFVGQKNLADS